MVQSTKKTLNLIAAILLVSLISFSLSISSAETSPAENLYKARCASCHSPDGAGKTPMGTALKMRDLASAEVQKQTDDDLNRIIAKGKNKMPAFDRKLKKEQIDQLVGYVRQLGKK
jgi:mono/diheme cytochrome c family protein